MTRLCADSARVGDSWSTASFQPCLLQSRALHRVKKATCSPQACYKCNKPLSLHLPAFILVSLPLHFCQDVIESSYLRGDGVNLDPDSIRVHPRHSRAAQTLRTGAELAAVVVGPDGAREEPWRSVGGAPLTCAGVRDSSRGRAGGVHTGRGLADGDSRVTCGICLG